MTDDLPPIEFLDAAAKTAGVECWANDEGMPNAKDVLHASIIAHACTLQRVNELQSGLFDAVNSAQLTETLLTQEREEFINLCGAYLEVSLDKIKLEADNERLRKTLLYCAEAPLSGWTIAQAMAREAIDIDT